MQQRIVRSKPGSDVSKYTNSEIEDVQKFAEFGRLSATLLHEISGPLTAALLQLESAPDKNSPHIRQARRSLRHL